MSLFRFPWKPTTVFLYSFHFQPYSCESRFLLPITVLFFHFLFINLLNQASRLIIPWRRRRYYLHLYYRLYISFRLPISPDNPRGPINYLRQNNNRRPQYRIFIIRSRTRGGGRLFQTIHRFIVVMFLYQRTHRGETLISNPWAMANSEVGTENGTLLKIFCCLNNTFM